MGLPLPEEIRPRYNIAPTQRILVFDGGRQLEKMQWGFVPVWTKETSKALINAKSETVREKRSFKSAIEKRRCLVPADGFYEWRRVDKRPFLFTVNGGEPFAFAGMWEEGKRCCILTTAPNSLLEPIHNRMPVILARNGWEDWLSAGPLEEENFLHLTASYPAEEMGSLEVSPVVNSARFDGPQCSEPYSAGEPRKLVMKRGKADDGTQGTFAF